MMQDHELLRAYWRDGSEKAFAELVWRYVDLVFSTARRQLGDAAAAEDVSQTVFCLLARKARGLSKREKLAGWLYRATCFCAARNVRHEMRRRKHEQEAMSMNSADDKPDNAWERLAPILDDGLARLNEQDRLVIILRFFQRQPFREISDSLGVTEAAAKMRTARALEKLRQFFVRRGVACSISGLTVALAERSIDAAPTNLAANLSRAALSGAGSLSLIQSALLLARMNVSGLALGASAAIVCAIIGWHSIRAARDASAVALISQRTEQTQGPTRSEAQQSSKTVAATTFAEKDDLADKIGVLRAALHSTDNTDVPGIPVIRAVFDLHNHFPEVFAVLKGETAAHDKTRLASDPDELAPRRAVSVMSYLGKSVPETVPFLWSICDQESIQSDSLAYLALAALDNIGFQLQDIDKLADEVLSRADTTPSNGDSAGNAFVESQATEWIANLIAQEPAASTPYVSAVENLLASPKADVRFWAACALLRNEGAVNPGIVHEISIGLTNGGPARVAWASQFLGSAGESAHPVVPALLEAAKRSTGNAREWAFLAAGKIQGDLRSKIPEVDRSMATDEANQGLVAKLNSGGYTAKDLIAMLQHPEGAAVAARLLAEQYPLAGQTMPSLCLAVPQQQSEEGRDEILTVIRKLDPTAALTPEDARTILTSLSGSQEIASLTTNNDLLEMSWSTRLGFQSFATNLASQNPAAYNTFVAAVLEKAPSWRSVLPQ